MEAELPPIDPALRIGSVRLAVGDVPRSIDFYERVLGLPLISHDEGDALLGPEREHPSLALTGLERPARAPAHSTGLFHVAWLHPSRAALAATVRRIVRGGWRIDGASDHGVSEALYLSDPDGLGIEIYADRPREQWQRPVGGPGVRMVTLPLDVEDLLAQAPAEQAPAEPTPAVAKGTVIGHVHLKVSDVARAVAFYRDALGFSEQARLPSAAFLSAGCYHHHVGLNSWQSEGASAPAENAPGLRLVEFALADADALAWLQRRLADAPGGPFPVQREPDRLSVSDPDGHLLTFIAERTAAQPSRRGAADDLSASPRGPAGPSI
jgi:catechol 2,3-dioxygenase